MESMKKALVLFVALALLVWLVPSDANAATKFTVASKSTVSLDLTLENIWGFEVESITFSNQSMVTSLSFDDTDLPRALGGDCTNNHPYYTASSVVSKAVFHILVKVAGNPGDKCTVTVQYKTSVSEGDAIVTKTPAPMVYEITIKQNTPATPSTPSKPMELGELNNQIAVAEGLEQGKYTAESWANLTAALTTAYNARNAKNQTVIDQAAAGLKNAIGALVKMDYLTLTAAISVAETLLSGDEAGTIWAELKGALIEASSLLSSGDQAKVDAAAQRLLDAISAVQRYLAQQEEPPAETQPQPQPTTPEDAGDRCDYPSHKIWPVLFWVSLALNVASGVLIVSYLIVKRKNRKDTTPLVEYEIEDDDE